MATLIVHLRDVTTGSPIPFTAVFVGSATGVTDIGGNLTLNMNAGTYSITVRSPMYVAAPGSPSNVNVPGEVTIQMARVIL